MGQLGYLASRDTAGVMAVTLGGMVMVTAPLSLFIAPLVISVLTNLVVCCAAIFALYLAK